MVNAAAKPKHTPSTKLALDDVLKSLQDLIRNDLPDVSTDMPPAAQVDSGSPAPTAKDLILELEAGLADLSAMDADQGTKATHAPDRTTAPSTADHPRAAKTPKGKGKVATTAEVATPATATLPLDLEPVLADLTALDTDLAAVESLTPEATRAPRTPPPASPSDAKNLTPSTTREGKKEKAAATPKAIATDATPPAAGPLNRFQVDGGETYFTHSPMEVSQEQNSLAPPLPEPPQDKTREDAARFEIPPEPEVAPAPTKATPKVATRAEPPAKATPGAAHLHAKPDRSPSHSPEMTQGSAFLQDEPPVDTELASLDNVHLDFSDMGDSFTIERDQSLTPETDTQHTPTAGHAWHTPELSLPSEEKPVEMSLSALDVPAAPARRREAYGLQSELPLNDPPHAPESKVMSTSPATGPRASTTPVSNFQPDTDDADNIPLLQDVFDAMDPAANPRTPATNQPAAEQSRRMAIQVAARLNVELRRSGKHALSSDVITRLARMLQETLAQSAPNVDNKPDNKD